MRTIELRREIVDAWGRSGTLLLQPELRNEGLIQQ
jgi:hypothetical protein